MSLSPPPLPQILLVDDNPDGLLVRTALLQEAGYSVQIARNGEDGLKLFNSNTFDVVVTDYRMPGMNGAEVIQKIREQNPAARIILLSGFVEPLGLTEGSTGADVVISKSANEAVQLVRSVKRLLNRGLSRKPPTAQKGASPRFRGVK